MIKHDMKTAWQAVREIFAARKCPADCFFLSEWEERHPPYLGDAPEYRVECIVSRPEDCPVFADRMENEHAQPLP